MRLYDVPIGILGAPILPIGIEGVRVAVVGTTADFLPALNGRPKNLLYLSAIYYAELREFWIYRKGRGFPSSVRGYI